MLETLDAAQQGTLEDSEARWGASSWKLARSLERRPARRSLVDRLSGSPAAQAPALGERGGFRLQPGRKVAQAGLGLAALLLRDCG